MTRTTLSNRLERKARVLIVDDHALVRLGLAELISHEPDLEVCGDAADADEALKKMEATRPDLLVVDISLKNSNGIELIKRLRARGSEIKILVSSMHDESLFAERALHAGAMGYISKQEATERVVEAIRQVLRGQIYLSAEMTGQLLHRVATGHETGERNSIERLSDRELEVFQLIGAGLSTRDIAERLHLSVKTIETHREHIKEKLSLKNGAELSRRAVQWALENQ